MAKRQMAVLSASMVALGVLYGFLVYWVIMSIRENILIHCVLMGAIFGLLNSLIALVALRKYSVMQSKNERLNVEIRKDKLTGLYNRRAFDDDIGRLDPETVHSMIFFDADNFREYNNVYGHQVGDKMLVGCANTVKSSIRIADLAYRYGGEEIVVILPGCNKKKAGAIAREIVESVRNNNIAPYPPMTISAGVASMPEDVQSFGQLVRASDLALLQAKRTGKDQVRMYNDSDKGRDVDGAVRG